MTSSAIKELTSGYQRYVKRKKNDVLILDNIFLFIYLYTSQLFAPFQEASECLFLFLSDLKSHFEVKLDLVNLVRQSNPDLEPYLVLRY